MSILQEPVGAHSAIEERPTAARFGVLFFLCTLALILYIDRACIGQAAGRDGSVPVQEHVRQQTEEGDSISLAAAGIRVC